MYIKIFFGNKPLFLCDAITPEMESFLHHDDAVFIDEFDSHTVKTMLHEMQQEKVHVGVFLHPDFEELKKAFYKKFEIIQAGGGLVQNENDKVLLIHRRGKWDLPKGKLDKGETIEACAIREVEEETGLRNITLISPLMITYHTYYEGTRHILKESHWYNMQVSGHQKLIPQTEEDIHAIKWVFKTDLAPYEADSFPSVADVLQTCFSK
jgi:8-oxo-dGTP pyrophosphatase MutT (NUDIX family)